MLMRMLVLVHCLLSNVSAFPSPAVVRFGINTLGVSSSSASLLRPCSSWLLSLVAPPSR